ncbi:hypothetical protein P7K49_009696 [Saguinus oedipus]|uniref:Neuronatin n=1 Tax=Saguinus oedipus TaxID=9490 RepID=A0ABQ9VLI9_SAGOE|nr:hypothetical protein P7K49_009696 [Saguinus oedipus]
MAAVAAASAELLIIGWYIFRVSVLGFRMGEGSPLAPPEPATRVAIAASRTHPILIAAIPACSSAATGTARPLPIPHAVLLALTLPSAPAPAREQRLGARRATAADDHPGFLATYAVRKTRYNRTQPQEGGGALLRCQTLQLAE